MMTSFKQTSIRSSAAAGLVLVLSAVSAGAQTVLDSNLSVRTLAGGLDAPSTMAFIGTQDILVTEKNTGRVQRVRNGIVEGAVLDLAVNFGSERGLLGIALHPKFPAVSFVYLYWTESTTGSDTNVLSETSVLGNRVDRFTWDGSALAFDRTLIRLRARQEDAGQPQRGNHNGGVLKFGPDGKLYVYMGDNGRRGQMQNLADGPGCVTPPCPAIPAGNLPDDQFGGPEPDNAHLTGVILRLNDDGSTPEDNPFFRAGAMRGGEAGVNLQKVFAYGIRNGFGMAFDPVSGRLWEAQNGDDTFTEMNIVEPGANLGWIQMMGPSARVAEFKAVETSVATDPFLGNVYFGLQQVRWSPVNIADTPAEARARLFMVFEGGDAFGATLAGSQEVPSVTTESAAAATFSLNADGTVSYELRATGPIVNATQAHIHLGGHGQNGPVTVFLFGLTAGTNFQPGDLIGSGVIGDDQVIERPGFDGTVATLVQRMRQGRTYVNLHTLANPGGEVRGQVAVSDRAPVSHYSDPEFSWKFEVAPAAVGFVTGSALGPQYAGDMLVGAARPFIDGGHLFRLKLTGNRRKVGVDDPAIEDRVADNLHKFDTTESESLLFGSGFGVATDILTGPNGNLYVVSLTNGAIYEIFRRRPGR
jgi:glucose/arabinose dehydrogenase